MATEQLEDANGCPWCGQDLEQEMAAERMSFDDVLGAHCEECEAYISEQGAF